MNLRKSRSPTRRSPARRRPSRSRSPTRRRSPTRHTPTRRRPSSPSRSPTRRSPSTKTFKVFHYGPSNVRIPSVPGYRQVRTYVNNKGNQIWEIRGPLRGSWEAAEKIGMWMERTGRAPNMGISGHWLNGIWFKEKRGPGFPL